MTRKRRPSTGESSQGPIFILTALAVLLADQLSKYFALGLSSEYFLIPKVLSFTLVKNTGAGFGLFQDTTPYLVWFSVIAFGAVLFFYDRITTKYLAFSVGLITGGLVGNLVDRVLFGFVVDFINFQVWPVFNIADSALTVGVVMLVVFLYERQV